MSVRVLFVCTGNVCRSPVAERLLDARVGDRSLISASSAGVLALVGHPIDEPSAQALRELGVDPEGHIARQLTSQLVAEADLVLTATSAHQSTVTRANPDAYRRVFTLLEFGRLSVGTAPADPSPDAAQLRERIGVVAARRGYVDAPEPGQDDVSDPFGAPLAVARRTATTIADGVDAVLAALGWPR
jgi:protein-tyrosine phosphatase